MDNDLRQGFYVGEWQIRPLAGTFVRDGRVVHVEPKVMDVLVSLARHPGQTVTRDELLDEVWNGLVVTDDVVTRCISELRTLLGDTDRERRYIRTVPKRGYGLIPLVSVHGHPQAARPTEPAAETAAVSPTPARSALGFAIQLVSDVVTSVRRFLRAVGIGLLTLIALLALILFYNRDTLTVTVEDDGQDVAQKITAARPVERTIESLAVLPFVNLTGNPEHDYFSDGLSEDIRNALITGSEIRVAARSSSRAFQNKAIDIQEIGRQLNVDALVEGTVRIDGDTLRVTAQLTQLDEGYSVWAASYERELGERIRAQVELASAIVSELSPSINGIQSTVVETPDNLQAHELYMLGRHHWHRRTPESLQQAIGYFERAIQLDAEYALAYSGLSDAHLFQVPYAGRDAQEALAEARVYAERALELGPELAEPHASMGMVFEHAWELEKARNAYQQAVKIKPQYSMAQMWLGNSWMALQDANRAFEYYEAALQLDPLQLQVQFNYTSALMIQGRYVEAGDALKQFQQVTPNDKLLELQLELFFYTGRFEQVLTAAVGRTYSGEFAPYSNEVVIRTLIMLRRFDEAAQMMTDNAGKIGEWAEVRLRGDLAIARRDAVALRKVAALAGEQGYKTNYIEKQACGTIWSTAWTGVADFIEADYIGAIAHFTRLVAIESPDPCVRDIAEIRLAGLGYLAASRLHVDPQDPEASRVLRTADAEIAALKGRGWQSSPVLLAEAAISWLRGDDTRTDALLEELTDEGWQLYSSIRFSPLFDSFRETSEKTMNLASLQAVYEDVKNQCEDIGLKKLGL